MVLWALSLISNRQSEKVSVTLFCSFHIGLTLNLCAFSELGLEAELLGQLAHAST